MSAQEIVRLMNEEEYAAIHAMQAVEEKLAQAAERVAEAFQCGGRTIFVGSGTSARIAAMEAAEMPPTFGVDPDRFIALVSGGPQSIGVWVDDPEDDEHAAVSGLNQIGLTNKDIVIGLTASGRTPFAVAALRHANQKGVWTCGIANNKTGSLMREADHAIWLDTGPEVLTGSTRLKAATALKLALDRITTAAMVLSGKVIENLMVDVKAKNQKLKERCARIVRDLSSATLDEAYEVLEANDWTVRRALEVIRNEDVAAARPRK
jgi:N-acetylmuramic acid 6-phosphate etherase